MQYTGERTVGNNGNTTEADHYYNEAMKHAKGLILDIACGDGHRAMTIRDVARKSNPMSYYYGGDISSEAVDYCRKHWGNIEGLRFDVMDITRLQHLDNSFDTYISIETVEHIRETVLLNALSEARRVLKVGGIYIGSTPDYNVVPYRPTCDAEIRGYHYRHYTAEELKTALVEVGFKSEDVTMFKLFDNSSVMWKAVK